MKGKPIYWIISCWLFVFILNIYGWADKKMISLILPHHLDKLLINICGTYKIQRLDDLNNIGDFKDFFIGKGVNNPGLAEGDFDGNGLRDYAVLVRKCPKSTRGLFIVFLQVKKGQFQFAYIRLESFIDDIGISIEKPGIFEESGGTFGPGSTKKVNVENESILFCNIKACEIIYWDPKYKGLFEMWVSG